ncbi:MAG: 2-hydroxy-3-oxopropionate reductase [Clostridium sp.]
MKRKIGFIGIGITGTPMIRNLMKAGYELVVYNHNENNNLKELVMEGAEQAFSPKEVAQKTNVIITMVPDSPQVYEVLLEKNGVIEGAREGSIVIDMSSISPMVTKRIALKLLESGIRMMDAPVSGGDIGAIKGTLAIMVGGKQEDFDECIDIFKAMGSSVTLIGENGAGQITKLANNMIVAINISAMSEALVFATKAGVDPEKVYKAIRGGSAGSNVLDNKFPKMINRDFNPGFKVKLHIKDLENAIESGHEVGSILPLTTDVMEIMQSLRVDGLELDDHTSIVKFYEKLSNIKMEKKDKN